jgi:hypothetical protein
VVERKGGGFSLVEFVALRIALIVNLRNRSYVNSPVYHSWMELRTSKGQC